MSTTPKKYIKQVEVEAFLWDGRAVTPCPDWLRTAIYCPGTPDEVKGCVMRLGNDLHIGMGYGLVTVAKPGTWVVYDNGKIYPVPPIEFAIAFIPTKEREDW